MVEKTKHEALEQRIKEPEKEDSFLRRLKFGTRTTPNIRFAICNRAYCYEAVSKGYLEAFNKTEDEIIGKPIIEIIGEKMFQTIIKANFDRALNGEVVNYSAWFDFPDSEKRFLNVHYYPVPSEDRINRVEILIQDLTQLRQTEEALVESQADYRKAQQLAHIGNWSWNAMEDRIICSDEFCRILGTRPENFIPTREGYIQYIHPEDIEIFNQVEKTGATDNSRYSKKYRIVRPDGDIRIIHEQGEATMNFAGDTIRIFGTIQDITELVYTEIKCQTIVQTAIDGFCLSDKQGRLIEVNDTFCRMLGYSREELLQLNFSDIDAGRTSEEIARPGREAMNKRQSRFETKHRCKDGTLMDVEINLQYSDIKKGIFVVFIRDITEKKRIIQTLEMNEGRYRDLFDRAPIMYVVTRNRKRFSVIADCNRQFLRTLNYSRADVTGKSITEFYTEDSRKKVVMEDSFKRTMGNQYIISGRELVTRDGRIIHTMIQAVPEYDLQGTVTGAFIMFVDMSSQKRAEEQLKESNEMLLMIFDGISDPIIMVDKKMSLIMMNNSAEAYFKKNNEICLGQKCHGIFKKRLSPCEGCKVPLTIHTGRKEFFERKGLMNPEELEQISIYPVLEKGCRVWAAIVRINDITNIRHMETELIQADKMISLGILVSGVAHEINNPNNFIMLNTPILWEAWKGIVPVIEKYYKEYGDFSLAGLPYSMMRDEIPLLFSGLENGTLRIQRIVQELKNFARQDDSDMDQSININQIIKNSIQMTQNLIKERTKHLKVQYGRRLPMIRGNAQRLEQVMINLIQNACQALPDTERGLFIRSSIKKTGSLVIEVRDEGVGIPENLLNRIMDPFFTTKRNEGGTGLGLAVSANIIKAHKGKIEVSTKIGKGSVFRIVIPVPTHEKPAPVLLADNGPYIGESHLSTLEEYE